MRKKIVFLPYDFDTAIGINNEGALVFSYNLEDIDQTEGGADVFNGQQSVLWKNLRACFFDELRTMYQTLRSNKALSYEKAEQMFEEHQEKWPEAVFNEDAWFKYLAPLVEKGNGAYLSMLQGSKAEQRKWWLYNRFRYMDSKYNAGDSLSDVITLRGYAKSDITITPYADIYATIKYGSYLVQTRAARNRSYLLACPLDNVNDTEIYIYSASQLASVGDLSGLMVGYANFAFATKLQSLKLGDADGSYSNGNLTELYLGNNELLREIDVRNCPALTQAVDISGCSNVERVYFDGTGITGLSLPNGGILKTLHLPASLVNLTLLNQTALTEFVFPVSDRLTTLRLENISPVVDSLDLLETMPINSRVRILGFQWEQDSYADIETLYSHLDKMRGIDESGGNTEKAQLSGTIHVPALSTDQMRELRSRYADIHLEADTWTYRVRFYHNGTLVHTAQVVSGSDAVDPVTAGTISTPEKPAEGNTAYTFAGWDKPITGITEDTDVNSTFEAHRAFEVTFLNWDGTFLYMKKVAENTACADPVQTGEIETPTRPGNANYVYSFLGWTGAGLSRITSDRTVTASYSEVQSYTIRFNNWDGTELLTMYLQMYAQIPNPLQAHLIETPVRPDDGSYEYVFSTWSGLNYDGSFPTVNGNKTFTASYTSTRYYTVTFKDYDDTVLLSERYYNGQTVTDPILDGRLEEPTREADENHQYFFWKWDYSFPRSPSTINVKAKYRTDAVYTVTYQNWDGTVLDVQQVSDCLDAEEPIEAGRINTPLRPSTAQYDYTFRGWSTNSQVITADRTITAQYDSVTRKYWATFMDDQTQLDRVQVNYGSAAYPSVDIAKPGDTDGAWFIRGWNPKVNSIYADTTTYAVWEEESISDSWAEILAAELDGTYLEKYHVGDVKMLDVGDEGRVAMRIVGFNKDTLADGNGFAPISWVSTTVLKSKQMFGYVIPSNFSPASYQMVEKTDSLGKYYESNTVGVSKSSSSKTFTIIANEETDVTLRAYCAGEEGYDLFLIWVNNQPISSPVGSDEGETRELTYHLTEGQTLSVHAEYIKDGNKDVGDDLARIRFLSEGDITVSASSGYFRRDWYGPSSWEESHIRTWLQNTVLPKLPSVVRNGIKTVTKNSPTAYSDRTAYVATSDKLWIPSKGEVLGTSSNQNYTSEADIQYSDYYVRSQDSTRAVTINGTGAPAFLRGGPDPNNHHCPYISESGFPPNSQPCSSRQYVILGFCT